MFFDIIIWLMLYSVLGWVYETILCSIEQRHFVKRGFLNGPYCPIYGFGAVADIVIIGGIANPALIFLAGAALSGALEYFTAWLLEALFHAKWWDYSHIRFNIKGRVCLLGLAAFGAFSVLLIKIIHPYIAGFTGAMAGPIKAALAAAVLAAILLDTALTVMQLSSFNEKLRVMQKFLTETLTAPNGYIEKARSSAVILKLDGTFRAMMNKITRPERRILRAFPRFKSTLYSDAVAKIRDFLKFSGGGDE